MRYYTLKERQQEEVNNFPMMFAFSKKQLEQGCEKLGVKDAESELYSIGAGGFIRRDDSKEFDALVNRLSDEMEEALKDYDFLKDALRYELDNHEYCITMDPERALNALGFTLEDVKNNDQLRQALNEVASKIKIRQEIR